MQMLLQPHCFIKSQCLFSPLHPQPLLPKAPQKPLFFLQPAMGNCLNTASERQKALPIDTPFNFPSPLPTWPSGGGFAEGSIDLGGLEVRQVSTFTKVWATLQGGAGDVGAGFFSPTQIPADFYSLGCYAQPNNQPLNGWVLVARDTNDVGVLAEPVDYTLIWSAGSTSIKRVGDGYFWLPTPPDGYKAVGLLVTDSAQKPSPDQIRCVRYDFTDQLEPDTSLWSTGDNSFGVSLLRPSDRGVQARGVCVGTFAAQSNGSPSLTTLACLKNLNAEFTSRMPNLTQIEALLQVYSPAIYLHPDEKFFPASVTWFFSNGALLYQKGNLNPTAIASDGSNLPQDGSNDGEYWIDLPDDDQLKEKIKAGDLDTTKVYLHVKPMLGGTFTDLALWVFYPFNGNARAKVEFLNIGLGRIGEHVGDWEHVTLRVSNFSGVLWRVYFAEHSSGEWLDASLVEYESSGNKPVVYASLHGHASYAKAGLVLQGNKKLGIGIRNDTAKGKRMDTGGRCELVAAEYELEEAVTEPAWLNYEREWGPKISYDIAKELKDVEKLLPKSLRRALEKLIVELPAEVLGEEGPTGPKDKSSWTMDEK